jgi:hypothetical protein
VRRAALKAALVLVAFFGVTAVVLGWRGEEPSEPAIATHAQVELGLDADATGNTATSVGTIQGCRVVTAGTLFDVDVYIKNVHDLLSWGAYLQYNRSVLVLTKPGNNSQGNNGQFMFQQAQAINSLYNASETLPDVDPPDYYSLAATDQAIIPGGGDTGSGVLLRLQFQAAINGFSSLKITPIPLGGGLELKTWIKDSYGNLINDSNGDGNFDGPISSAGISVGGSCVDDDGDGVPNTGDNCPTIYNPFQENNDTDSMGNACDPDDDNDGLLDQNEPGPCVLVPDCDYDNVSDGNLDPDFGGPIVAGPDNCIQVHNTNQANNDGDSLGDACDPDDDNDTVPDGSDNCPFASNSNQLNSDGKPDGGDACDSDDDDDGFSDTLEGHIGTMTIDHCADSSTPNNEADDKWGADFDDNQVLNIADMNSFLFPLRGDGTFNKFGHPVPDPQDPTIARWDLSQSTTINIGDLNAINPAVVASTSRPPMFNGQPAFFYGSCTILP